ncbi:hypothetical protein ACFZB9_17885 [Kitasatospora sp. NPDC008050]|uniref:hypothetical protein n=1 Tax=Kitasatospora sp. NPDC008050 TaxID=3364021 RepID=UPI0036EED874
MTGNQIRYYSVALEDIPERRRKLRETGPVRYAAGRQVWRVWQVWRVLGHESVATVLADPVTFSSDLSPLAPTAGST